MVVVAVVVVADGVRSSVEARVVLVENEGTGGVIVEVRDVMKGLKRDGSRLREAED